MTDSDELVRIILEKLGKESNSERRERIELVEPRLDDLEQFRESLDIINTNMELLAQQLNSLKSDTISRSSQYDKGLREVRSEISDLRLKLGSIESSLEKLISQKTELLETRIERAESNVRLLEKDQSEIVRAINSK